MPVAVCAGLAYPVWREGSHIGGAAAHFDRAVMVDVRNLDALAEEQLIRQGIPIVPVSAGAARRGLRTKPSQNWRRARS